MNEVQTCCACSEGLPASATRPYGSLPVPSVSEVERRVGTKPHNPQLAVPPVACSQQQMLTPVMLPPLAIVRVPDIWQAPNFAVIFDKMDRETKQATMGEYPRVLENGFHVLLYARLVVVRPKLLLGFFVYQPLQATSHSKETGLSLELSRCRHSSDLTSESLQPEFAFLFCFHTK